MNTENSSKAVKMVKPISALIFLRSFKVSAQGPIKNKTAYKAVMTYLKQKRVLTELVFFVSACQASKNWQ